MATRHVLKISDLSRDELLAVLEKTIDLKAHPERYATAMKDKTLLMLFQKPSLRTRVSFEVGMTQMGGHGIFYSIADSPLGVKESYEDTGKVLSRFVDVIMARVNKKEDVRQLAANSTIPVINALDDWAHPCQMLADLTTIVEKRGGINCFRGFKMAYCGDCRNNVTYDLMRAAAVVGYEIRVAGPAGPGYEIHQEVLDECAALCKVSGGNVIVAKTAEEACTGVDAIYTDSWMSYGIPKDQVENRIRIFEPFRVTAALLKLAKPDAIFMNCLPAARGMEQTAEVIDGPQSVVFDEAENRLHSCKALMLFQLGIGFGAAPAQQKHYPSLGALKTQAPEGVAEWLKAAAGIDAECYALLIKNKVRWQTLCECDAALLVSCGFTLGDACAIMAAVRAVRCCM